MIDLSGMPPAYMGIMNFHGVTDPSAKGPAVIEESNTGNSLSGSSTSGQPNISYKRPDSANNNSVPDAENDVKPPIKRDENAIAGPPPTFTISILEMERDLSEALARMNAQQSLSRDVEAVSAKSADDARQAESDAARDTVARDTAARAIEVRDTAALESTAQSAQTRDTATREVEARPEPAIATAQDTPPQRSAEQPPEPKLAAQDG